MTGLMVGKNKNKNNLNHNHTKLHHNPNQSLSQKVLQFIIKTVLLYEQQEPPQFTEVNQVTLNT
jgi:hypothetical protein